MELREGSEAGTFETLTATLTANYAGLIYEVRQVEATYGHELSDEASDALDNVSTRSRR